MLGQINDFECTCVITTRERFTAKDVTLRPVVFTRSAGGKAVRFAAILASLVKLSRVLRVLLRQFFTRLNFGLR